MDQKKYQNGLHSTKNTRKSFKVLSKIPLNVLKKNPQNVLQKSIQNSSESPLIVLSNILDSPQKVL